MEVYFQIPQNKLMLGRLLPVTQYRREYINTLLLQSLRQLSTPTPT
ncbi:hypothetical protein HMPREF1578_00220 [Gardnerella pickettii JCP8017B]|nr:hypothetical protein HMPREF1578_00220 [Gardnerella pickettii JCP8017B]